ncbi:uncharacterized protein LOC142790406 [Rhipicephalus microplus]|uniref:uncharacterized protein LOC142790406 n=1 Tax=Rhipicephalus microplus TaxID=6941 RepID=UPI003F6D5E63
MTFVLVKWVSESKGDVYPVSCIEDAAIGYRLYTDRKSIGDLRGTIVNVRWDQNKDPEPATLLDLESYHIVKKLKYVIEKVESSEGHVVRPVMVDIGSGVMVEELQLDNLKRGCLGNSGKFARGLQRILFSPEELKGKYLFGKKCNAEPRDPVRVKAVIGKFALLLK